MKRYKRLILLAVALAVVCAGTFALTRYEEKQEEIQNANAVVLELPADTVQALSWQMEEGGLAFHREEGSWVYDEDAAFPASGEKIAALLSRYESFVASFIIENVEDYSQYGLDEPECVLTLTTEEQTLEIRLGAFSKMDQQRYVDIGDGNVYLVPTDPMDDLSTELSDMIRHDEIPTMETVTAMSFTGWEEYSIQREEESDSSYSEEDIYFAQLDGASLPLDSLYVEDYLDTVQWLELNDYATYNVTEEELAQFGMDEPLLTVTLDYDNTAEDNETVEGTVVLHVSRNPEEQATYEEALAAGEDLPDVTRYVRIGDSQIVYRLGEAAYTTLMAAGYDDLRHREVIWADFAGVTRIDVTLEEETHTLTTEASEEDEDTRIWLCDGKEVEIGDFEQALAALSAEHFTDETPTEKEEISLTVYLEDENFPQVEIGLYRYDGSVCLAMVDGQPVSLIPRSQAVELIEAVQAMVLN